MKVSNFLVTLAAVATQAAAVSSSGAVFKDGVGACNLPGQKCHTVKNAARDILNAIDRRAVSTDTTSFFCDVPGTPGCNELHGSVKKIQDAAIKAYHTVAAREAEAEAEAEADPRGWIGYCGAPGTSCNGKRDVEAKARSQMLDASAAKEWVGVCGVPGAKCNDRREADPRGWIGYCGAPGTSCNGKREADPRGWVGYCGAPGTSCNGKREADPKGWIGYCGAPGTSCNGKRSAEDPAGFESLQNAIRKFNPAVEKDECFQDGKPCNLIQHAARALHENQRREAEARGWIGYCGAPGTSCNGKRALQVLKTDNNSASSAFAHLNSKLNGSEAAVKAEQDCHAPNGACTLAARALEELESAVSGALADIES